MKIQPTYYVALGYDSYFQILLSVSSSWSNTKSCRTQTLASRGWTLSLPKKDGNDGF